MKKLIPFFLLSAFIAINSSTSFALPGDELSSEEGEARLYSEKNPATGTADSEPVGIEDEDSHSIWMKALLYLPNRVLDLFDIFRIRGRVGPGLAGDVRVTKFANIFAGTYVSAYAGLPGPRMRKIPRSPLGLESMNGVRLGILDGSTGLAMGPEYSPTEIGLGAHLGIVGADVGIDPMEIADFFTGIFLIDLRDDDL